MLAVKENFVVLNQVKFQKLLDVSAPPSPLLSPSGSVGIGEGGGVGVMTLHRLTAPTPGKNSSERCPGVLRSSLRYADYGESELVAGHHSTEKILRFT